MKLDSFDSIVRALDSAGVRYLVAGGLAVNAHGYLRFTALGEIGYRPLVPVGRRG